VRLRPPAADCHAVRVSAQAESLSRRHAPLASISLAAAVAIAFADSSIVVLALPQLLAEFDTTITPVSFVITAYNLAVTAVALALAGRLGPAPPRTLATIGLTLFLAASLACAFAGTLAVLIAFRCVQGAGAALLMTGALPVLVAGGGSERRGVDAWVTAGVVGAVLGPALGGVLTEAFDWRAIFLVQAPVAALALPAAFKTRAEHVEEARPAQRRAAAANVALGLVFAALVGALFLVVVLLVEVWGLSPLAAAAVVSALPVATILGSRLERSLAGVRGAAAGAFALATGLLGLALLPASSVTLVVALLLLCGVGLGLALPFLTRASLDGGPLVLAGARSIAARHAGLVLALVLVAPVLAAGVEHGSERAALGATADVLDAPVGIADKVSLALALDRTIDETPSGSMPDIDEAFEDRDDEGLQELRDRLVETLEATLTRSFRTSFALAALFAALAPIPLVLLWRRGAA
jgi:predicted MFS family arabinose efflux permease